MGFFRNLFSKFWSWFRNLVSEIEQDLIMELRADAIAIVKNVKDDPVLAKAIKNFPLLIQNQRKREEAMARLNKIALKNLSDNKTKSLTGLVLGMAIDLAVRELQKAGKL